MAFENDRTGTENLAAGAAAGEDLTTHQGKAVVVTGVGVKLAFTVTDSGRPYVLANAPSSGAVATVYGGPNVAIAKASAAIALGDYVTVSTSAYFASTTSFTYAIGQARTAVASGLNFALRMF